MAPSIKSFLFFFLLLSSGYSHAQQHIVRGTWITNVESEAMRSPENIRQTVSHCKRNGLTDIFVVVWNRGLTMHPSKVTKRYIGIAQDPVYDGFDPLKIFIDEGHKVGLRVHAWFEFGFSYAYKDSSAQNWLSRYPEWAGKDRNGNLLKKNNFFWWNSIHPAVQQFMQELVLEVVRNYDIDGIQGDDRLPAMPSEGGYDDFTKKLYAKEHEGASPPSDPKEQNWLQWKADKLSDFGKKLYKSVKKVNQNCIVSWAPSIYPWSKEQYLQDWPNWLHNGYADWIFPQVYRYKLDAYEQTLKAIDSHVKPEYKSRVFPGILTSLGNGYRVDDTMFKSMLQINRKYGYNGEVLFYYETIRESVNPVYQ